MQISKLFPMVCAIAFCASFIAVRAEDTPAQAAARAALMEKMNALETQPAQPAPSPIVVTPSGATQAQPSQPTNVVVIPPPAAQTQPAAPAPETQPKPGTEAVQTAPAASDAEAQAKARAALQQKMSEMNQQEWTTPVVAPAATPAPRPEVIQPATPAVKPAAPQTQPVAVTPAKPAPPAVKPEAMTPANQINAAYPGKELGLKPIEAPPLPISAAKEAQLQALLERYKADQITPEAYHNERAKILAEP
ncbi:MAG: hypothetical protein ABSA45_08530 [Verrucomicrobiota bacterium]|jgi:hypothetical protein